MKKVKKYVPLILLLLPVCVIWMPWYKHMIKIPEELVHISADGILVALEADGRVGIIYVLCNFIQFLGIKHKEYIFPIVSNLILVCVLIYYPLILGHYYSFTAFEIFIRDYYTYGFYFSITFITLNIITNLIQFIIGISNRYTLKSSVARTS